LQIREFWISIAVHFGPNKQWAQQKEPQAENVPRLHWVPLRTAALPIPNPWLKDLPHLSLRANIPLPFAKSFLHLVSLSPTKDVIYIARYLSLIKNGIRKYSIDLSNSFPSVSICSPTISFNSYNTPMLI